jgi:hypothetical protein
VEVDFADYDGNVSTLEVSTDVTQDLEPARLEVDGETRGERLGTITMALRDIPRDASELRLALVDENGQRSPVYAWRIPAGGDGPRLSSRAELEVDTRLESARAARGRAQRASREFAHTLESARAARGRAKRAEEWVPDGLCPVGPRRRVSSLE